MRFRARNTVKRQAAMHICEWRPKHLLSKPPFVNSRCTSKCPPTGRPACLPACLSARRPACLPAHLLACRPAGLPACLPARLPACPPRLGGLISFMVGIVKRASTDPAGASHAPPPTRLPAYLRCWATWLIGCLRCSATWLAGRLRCLTPTHE